MPGRLVLSTAFAGLWAGLAALAEDPLHFALGTTHLRPRQWTIQEAAALDLASRSRYILTYRWNPERREIARIDGVTLEVALDATRTAAAQQRFLNPLPEDAFLEIQLLAGDDPVAVYRHSRFPGRPGGFYRLDRDRYTPVSAAPRAPTGPTRLELIVRKTAVAARVEGRTVARMPIPRRPDGLALTSGLWRIDLRVLEVRGLRRRGHRFDRFDLSVIRPARSREPCWPEQVHERVGSTGLLLCAGAAALLLVVGWRRRQSWAALLAAIALPPWLLAWVWIPSFELEAHRIWWAVGLVLAVDGAILLCWLRPIRLPRGAAWVVAPLALLAAELALRRLPTTLFARGFLFDDRSLLHALEVDYWPDHRFRGVRVAPGAHAETLRLLLVGGSSVYGFPYRTGARAFSALLERQLRDRLRRPVEVLNAGVLGFTTLLEREAAAPLARYRPDLVIVYPWFNDNSRLPRWFHTLPQLTDAQAAVTLRRQLEQPGVQRWRALLGRIRSLAFLRAGLLFLLRTEAEPNPGLFPPRGTVSEVERQLIQFVQRWRSSGARVALCPEAYAYAPPLAQAELENLYVRAVVRAARASGAPLLDVLTPLAQRPHDTLFLDVVHPSLAGHEAIALALARELERHPSLLATGTAGVR